MSRLRVVGFIVWIPAKVRFFFLILRKVRIDSGSNKTVFRIGNVGLPTLEQSGRGVRLSTRLHLVPEIIMSWAIPSLLLYALMAYTVTNFTVFTLNLSTPYDRPFMYDHVCRQWEIKHCLELFNICQFIYILCIYKNFHLQCCSMSPHIRNLGFVTK